ncbi:hypothetical protein [Amycolatopsis benzoatilytica]|uniref:hypothetical protein n=1 Tax=Amycolatopsis benzoatilytica TaxID=346045 RepID=UPI00036BB8E9|nr:hypothetical protein [Amycolatopsis benzoatilytica]
MAASDDIPLRRWGNLRALVAGFKDWAEADFEAVSAARADYGARSPDLASAPEAAG